jgi:Mor family transcriptional regulator
MGMVKREIFAKEILNDIKSGMDDVNLSQKYKLTVKGLDSVFRKMIAAGLISQQELNARKIGYEEAVDFSGHSTVHEQESALIPSNMKQFDERDAIRGEPAQLRKLKAKDVAKDVYSGMGDTLLMKKYRLNPEQLESVLRKLLEADLITHMQLYERTSISDSQITRAFVESGKAIGELDQH